MYSEKYEETIYKSKIDDFYKKYFSIINPDKKKYVLNDSNKKLLVKFEINSKYIHKTYTINKKILKYMKNNLLLTDIGKNELMLYEIDIKVNNLRMMSELLYEVNRNILFREIIDVHGKLHKNKLRKKINCNDDEINEFDNLFFIKFRNAMSHLDYFYEFDDGRFKYLIWDDEHSYRFSLKDIDAMLYNISYLQTKMYELVLCYY